MNDPKEQFIQDLAKVSGLPADTFDGIIEVPQNPEHGDLALPCFHLARTMRKNPAAIAAELGEQLQAAGTYAAVTPVNAYLNVALDRTPVMEAVVRGLLGGGLIDQYASDGSGKRVVIEYSSPNITKPFHMGHLRTTVIGNCIANMHKALGYDVVRLNYLGDWGTQFGKLITAFKRWGDRDEVAADPIAKLTELYIRFNSTMNEDEEAQNEAREWFRKLETGDEEARELWNWFKSESMKEIERLYARLGTPFDEYSGESRYVDGSKTVVDSLTDKGLTRESEGAVIVDLEQDELGVAIVRKADGTSIYAVRDISAAIDRYETYGFAKMVYVTDAGQSLHFKQVFKILEKMEQPFCDRLVHVPYGLVHLRDGKMSTRQGNVVYLEDVLTKAVEMVGGVIEDKNPDLKDRDSIAEAVGTGAVIFSQLSARNRKDITFDWDDVLNFNGETGPYAQYTHARLCSILRKHGEEATDAIDFSLLSDDSAYTLGKWLLQLPGRVRHAAEHYEPSFIAAYLIDVCTAANAFYNKCRVLSDDAAERAARIALVESARRVIAVCLKVLGMQAPEEM